MLDTSLRFGTQLAVDVSLSPDRLGSTVGEQIERLLRATPNKQISTQLRAATKDPNSIIEIRSGKQVQIATPNMPLRELLSPEAGDLEITVSKPHVGG